MHPAESPLAGEGTPTSALTAATGGPAASTGQRVLADAQEVASYSPEGSAAEAAQAVEDSTGAAAEPAPASELPEPVALGSHRSGEHMVWTNEDGDIDALPWDMGGWSTGSSGEHGPQQQQQQQQQQDSAPAADEGQEQRQPGHPVGEDALIGALRRKVGLASECSGLRQREEWSWQGRRQPCALPATAATALQPSLSRLP